MAITAVLKENQNLAGYCLTLAIIIVHIFNKEDRLFYDLERLWRDAISVSKEQLGIKEAAL